MHTRRNTSNAPMIRASRNDATPETCGWFARRWGFYRRISIALHSFERVCISFRLPPATCRRSERKLDESANRFSAVLVAKSSNLPSKAPTYGDFLITWSISVAHLYVCKRNCSVVVGTSDTIRENRFITDGYARLFMICGHINKG